MKLSKTVLTALIPVLVIVIYSVIFHVNILSAVETTNPIIIIFFFLTYLGSIGIISVRDMLITKQNYAIALKARMLGNAVGLIIPGWAGPDLTRSIVYSLKDKGKLVEYFSLSIYEAFYDVVTICILFIFMFPFFFSPLAIFFVLVALVNIAGWSGGLAYVYIFSEKTNRIESFIFSNFKYARNVAYYYSLVKKVIRRRIGLREMIIYYLLSACGYFVLSIPIFFFTHNILESFYVMMLYLTSELVPIPAGSGFAEYSLSIFLSPVNVLRARIFTLLSYILGFMYVNEINLEELKKEFKNLIKEDGSISKGQ